MTSTDLPQTDWLGVDESICSAAEFLASRQASQAVAEDEMTSAGYGLRSLTLFEYLVPASSWRKTLSASLASSLTGWTGSAGHFETSVTSHGRSSSPLTTWVPHTLDDESGSLLPTPSASSYGTSNNGQRADGSVFRTAGKPSLETMARKDLWPTPTSTLGDHAGLVTPTKGREGGTLVEAVSQKLWPTPQAYSHGEGVSVPGLTPLDIAVRPEMAKHAQRAKERKIWPTPTAGDSKSSGSRNTSTSAAHFGVSLTDAIRGDQGTGRIRGEQKLSARVRMIPTPSANDGKGSSKPGQRRRQLTDPAMGVIPLGGGGALNPTWVEILMGFPAGFTDLSGGE
jgi:hypothetical protein